MPDPDPDPGPSVSHRVTLLAIVLASAATLAIVGPTIRPRHEARWLDVTVDAGPIGSGAVSVRVRARNTHPRRRRVFTEYVDLSESLGRLGRVTRIQGNEPARRLPIARVWRVPFVAEIAPGEVRDLAVRIDGVPPGLHEGTVDVVLDGTNWVRRAVRIEVPESAAARAGSGPGEAN